MFKRFLLSIAAMLMALCAIAQSEFYVVLKDGSAQSYPSEKVDSLTFKNPEVNKIMGFGDMMKMIDSLMSELSAMRSELESVKAGGGGSASHSYSEYAGVYKYGDGYISISDKGKAEWLCDRKSGNVHYRLDVDSTTGLTLASDGAILHFASSADDSKDTYILNSYGKGMISINGILYTSEMSQTQYDSLRSALLDYYYGSPSVGTKSGDGYYVDLGLQSKTMWATYNVGAKSPEEYGDYFAWGETETKETYTDPNSKWCGVANSDLKTQGVIDADGSLTVTYDAASANWGADWRMPNKVEVGELVRDCEFYYATYNGVKGYKVVGSLGSTFFLPFAGRRDYDGLGGAGEYGDYWSATAGENGYFDAYCLSVYSEDAYLYYDNRYYGFSVRPVLRTK